MSSSVSSRGFFLFWEGACWYGSPGSTWRILLTLISTCLTLSMIFPFSSVKIKLLCRPISSAIKYLVVGSPNSVVQANSITKTRSNSRWRTCIKREGIKCLRSSIQKKGARIGFSFFCFVRWTRAWFALALRIRRTLSRFVRNPITISSCSG